MNTISGYLPQATTLLLLLSLGCPVTATAKDHYSVPNSWTNSAQSASPGVQANRPHKESNDTPPPKWAIRLHTQPDTRHRGVNALPGGIDASSLIKPKVGIGAVAISAQNHSLAQKAAGISATHIDVSQTDELAQHSSGWSVKYFAFLGFGLAGFLAIRKQNRMS